MLIDKKIERYVRDAAKHVPARYRGGMSRELTDMIHEMVVDYAAGEEPDVLDVRDVLRDLGTPEDVASTYMESKLNRVEEHHRRTRGEFIDWAQLIYRGLSILGAVLVIIGVIGIGTQRIQTMLPLFLGVVCALVSVMGRSVLTSVLHILPHHDE